MKAKTETIFYGTQVFCDLCNKEHFAEDGILGGFLFGSKAVCPACGPKFERDVKKYQEEHLITKRAEEKETFYHFVQRLRDFKPGTITITTLE